MEASACLGAEKTWRGGPAGLEAQARRLRPVAPITSLPGNPYSQFPDAAPGTRLSQAKKRAAGAFQESKIMTSISTAVIDRRSKSHQEHIKFEKNIIGKNRPIDKLITVISIQTI